MSREQGQYEEEPLDYEKEELTNWREKHEGAISILLNSNAPVTIKRTIGYRKGFIIDKNGCCLGRRIDSKGRPVYKGTIHFDVAKVAASNASKVKAGWYGSYDWLTNPHWILPSDEFSPGAGDRYLNEFKTIYQKALTDNIGIPALKKLQKDAKKLPEITEPDLWFIKNDGTFQFIEAKYGTRDLEDKQIAGLALLSKNLNAEIRVVRLHEKNKNINLTNFTDKFKYFCSLL